MAHSTDIAKRHRQENIFPAYSALYDMARPQMRASLIDKSRISEASSCRLIFQSLI